jgi:hypothetical protein
VRLLGLRLEREQGPGVALEKSDIGAEAADGQLERQDAFAGELRQRLSHQRRLAIAPWRDQEHLLAFGQVGDQAIELEHPVRERLERHDLAVDEGVLHAVTSIDVMITQVDVTSSYQPSRLMRYEGGVGGALGIGSGAPGTAPWGAEAGGEGGSTGTSTADAGRTTHCA